MQYEVTNEIEVHRVELQLSRVTSHQPNWAKIAHLPIIIFFRTASFIYQCKYALFLIFIGVFNLITSDRW